MSQMSQMRKILSKPIMRSTRTRVFFIVQAQYMDQDQYKDKEKMFNLSYALRVWAMVNLTIPTSLLGKFVLKVGASVRTKLTRHSSICIQRPSPTAADLNIKHN